MYVLEHAGEFVRSHGLKPEDVIGISTTQVRQGRGLEVGRT